MLYKTPLESDEYVALLASTLNVVKLVSPANASVQIVARPEPIVINDKLVKF